MLIFGVVMTTFGSVLPDLIKLYSLDKITAGLIASALSAGIMAGSLSFGPLADRYGFKLVLIANILFVVLGLEMISLGTTHIVLYAAVFMIGLGGGTLNGATGALVSDISGDKKGANLSTLGVFFGVGALGMPSVLGFFRDFFSVSDIIGITGIVVFTFVIYLFFIKFPAPKHAEGISLNDTFKLIKSPGIFLAGITLLFGAGAETLMATWLSLFLSESRGFSINNSLYFLSFYIGVFTLTRIVLSIIFSKFSPILITLALQFVAIFGCFFLFGESPTYVTMGIILMAIGFAPNFPVIMGYVGELFSEYSGTAFSIILSIGIIGNLVVNYLMGFFSEKYSVGVFPYLAIITTFFILLTLFVFKKYLNKLKLK